MRRPCLLILSLVLLAATSCQKDCTCPEPKETKTLTLQPGAESEDVIVAMRATDGGVNAAGNHNHLQEIGASRWTYDAQGWGTGTNRSYIKFTGLSEIPANATIKSAKLSFWGVAGGGASPQGNSTYPGSPYSGSGENTSWLKRVTGDWSEGTINWNNKPATTDVNQVEVPASNLQWNFNVANLDVTNLVKDMVSNSQNYGFAWQLQTEQHYRCITFSSGEATDASKRPKLVVEYEEQ